MRHLCDPLPACSEALSGFLFLKVEALAQGRRLPHQIRKQHCSSFVNDPFLKQQRGYAVGERERERERERESLTRLGNNTVVPLSTIHF
jgi:hypothetical protein